MMAIFDSLLDKMGNAFLPTFVVSSFKRYAGDGCKDLKKAIILNIDIYQLWTLNWEREGLTSPDSARRLARMYPNGKNLLTVPNIRQWMADEGCTDMLCMIDSTKGGDVWLRWTLENFKKGLWYDD